MNGDTKQTRVPQTLQAVFLASQRGKDVYKPPPEKVAYKVFFRNWLMQKQASCSMNKDKQGQKAWNDLYKKNPKQNEEAAASKKVSPYLRAPSSVSIDPQKYLETILKPRGYSVKTFKTLQTAYHNKPTQFQQASYHVHLINMVRQNNLEGLKAIINSGISTNPCNNFGESLLHNICRRGNEEALDIMLAAGSQLQVADDYGRTPLHDACWAPEPCFEVIQRILDVDRRLFFMEDARGALPLSYAKKDHWASWIEFLNARKDDYFPPRDLIREGPEADPPLAKYPPNSRPIPEPKEALTVELAAMVASGKIKPQEAELLRYDRTEDSSSYDSDESSYYDSDYSDSEDDSDLDSDSDSEFDVDEMNQVLAGFSGDGGKVAW